MENPGIYDDQFTQRRWRVVGVSLLLVLIIVVLVVVAVLLVNDRDTNPPNPNPSLSPITLEEILARNFSGNSTIAYWISSGLLIYKINESLMLANVTGTTISTQELLKLTEDETNISSIAIWLPSSSGRYVTIAHQREKLYRRSSLALYTIIDTINPAITFNVGPSKNGSEKLRIFKWNPSYGASDFMFVCDNDVWYQDGVDGTPFQVTTSGGAEQYIYNGVPDWLYEEEILSADYALWWSPNGEYVAFASFNDSTIPLIEYPLYYDDKMYPVINKVPYSKAGEPLPTVRLLLWERSMQTQNPVELQPPQEVISMSEYYLFRVSWLSEDFQTLPGANLIVVWANRCQNITFISICNVSDHQCYLNYKQEYNLNGYQLWEEPFNMAVKYSTHSTYFVLLPQASGSNVFTRVASVSVLTNFSSGTPNFLNTGDYDVTSIVGYNSLNGTLYFLAAYPLPRNRHLYSVSVHENSQQAQCLTCWMESSMNCGTFQVSFDSNGDTYLLSCSGPGRPRKFLRQMSNNETSMVLQNNTALGKYIQTKALPVVQHTTVQMSNGLDAIVKLQLPPDYDSDSKKKFPLFLSVYAGPGSQKVTSGFFYSFDQFLVSNRSYVLAHIDARGSGYRGWKYKAPIYRNLGTVEIQDQLEVAQKLANKYSYIDKDRVGVWGWSYGGFATAYLIVEDRKKIFKCAASVAPVTYFRYYDAAWTERYMGLPETNEAGYNKTDIMRNATNFMDHNYLLIHGTADDNVHFQNTVMLAKALIYANVQFNLMIYPNQGHGIWSRKHLYTLLDAYFKNCFATSHK